MKGALGHHVPDPSGNGLAVTPFPQVGFPSSEAGPFTWYPLHEIPTKDELVAKGYEGGTTLYTHTWGAPISACLAELKANGFSGLQVQEEVQPPTGPVKAETVALVSDLEFRAACKIALNYLAGMEGAAFVLQPQFNEARRFSLNDVQPPATIVSFASNPWVVERQRHRGANLGALRDRHHERHSR